MFISYIDEFSVMPYKMAKVKLRPKLFDYRKLWGSKYFEVTPSFPDFWIFTIISDQTIGNIPQ